MTDNSVKEPANAGAAPAGQASTDAPNPTADGTQTVLDQLSQLGREVRNLASGYAGLRSLVDRKFSQLTGNTGNENAQSNQGGVVDEEEEREKEELRRDAKIARFLQDFPEARENWQEILKLVANDQMAEALTAYTARGKVDYYKSYRNALREVQAAKYSAAQRTAAETRATTTQQSESVRAQATGSGVTAEPDLESLSLEDIEKMTPEEMEKAGITKYFSL